MYMGIAYESNNLGLPLLAPHSNPVVRQTFIKAEELNSTQNLHKSYFTYIRLYLDGR